jgi:hypothetical protein
MNVQQLLDYFFKAAIITLDTHGLDGLNRMSDVEYLPTRCLLVENTPRDSIEANHANTIGLLGNLLSSIIWIDKKMTEGSTDQSVLAFAFNRITRVCAMLLTFDKLSKPDLFYISQTEEYQKVKNLLKKPAFFREFDESELGVVKQCFGALKIQVGPEFGGLDLGADDGSAYASPSRSNQPPTSGKQLFVGNNQSTSSLSPSAAIPFGQPVNGFSFTQPAPTINFKWGSNAPAPQAQVFGFGTNVTASQAPPVGFGTNVTASQAPPVGFGTNVQRTEMSPEEALRVLDFPGIDKIGSGSQISAMTAINSKIKELNSRGVNTVDMNKKAGQVLRDILFPKGGKRRTMKTKKRIYKKVKKTRLRRNNKSKRVLKEKRIKGRR